MSGSAERLENMPTCEACSTSASTVVSAMKRAAGSRESTRPPDAMTMRVRSTVRDSSSQTTFARLSVSKSTLVTVWKIAFIA